MRVFSRQLDGIPELPGDETDFRTLPVKELVSRSMTVSDLSPKTSQKEFRFLLMGNPNTGKTLLFNRLTGMRSKSANYPGVTVDVRSGHLQGNQALKTELVLIDCPGVYSLDVTSLEEQATLDLLNQSNNNSTRILCVVDATNLTRNLVLVSQLLQRQVPVTVIVNFVDAAREIGLHVDTRKLSEQLGCPTIEVSARNGEGFDRLVEHLFNVANHVQAIESENQKPALVALPEVPSRLSECMAGCKGCQFGARFAWAQGVASDSVQIDQTHSRSRYAVQRLDKWLTGKFTGPLAMLVVMFVVFSTIFSLADVPMTLIEELFGWLGRWTGRVLETIPSVFWIQRLAFAAISFGTVYGALHLAGIRQRQRSIVIAVAISAILAFLPREDFHSLVVDGIIAGISGVVVFLPQICILFFLITLLEDSGYLARGAFVMERFMRFVGLPGAAFVPMLSAHACAIPAIMATRTIACWRDRLVTILVLPLLTCSARLPVYVMVVALLFGDRPFLGAIVFASAYMLGIAAALGCAFVLKHSLLTGEPTPLVIELPPYRLPSFRNAILAVIDRAKDFLANAGTVILLISVSLWFLASYPRLPEGYYFDTQTGQLVETSIDTGSTTDLTNSQERVAQSAIAYSFAGRLGRLVEPVFEPLGFDWKIDVAILSSFAAREVLVSTLSIVYGLGEEGAEETAGLTQTLKRQVHADGTPVFDYRTGLSLLVFFVLAMQCLPTQAVTRRETGSWKWALFQLAFMTVLAYLFSWLTFQLVTVFS